MMLEELQRRNYSESTTRYYIRAVEEFARRFNRPPDRLGLRHIREYQAELFQKQKLSSGTVNNRLAPLAEKVQPIASPRQPLAQQRSAHRYENPPKRL